MGQDKNVFFKSDDGQTGPENAIESCKRCGNLEWCGLNLGDIAMRLSSYDQDSAVIAGNLVQWRVSRPVPDDPEGPLPEDGDLALEYLRVSLADLDKIPTRIKRIVQDRADAIKIPLQETYDSESCSYDQEDIDLGVDRFARALIASTPDVRKSFRDGNPVFKDMAHRFLEDAVALRSLGIRRPFNSALRHGPEYFRDLIEKYADNSDVNRFVINISTERDTRSPDHAVQDYLLRLAIYRQFYKDDPDVDDYTIQYCCSRYVMKSCYRKIEEWRNKYAHLTQKYENDNRFEPWMLKQAALYSAGRQQQRFLDFIFRVKTARDLRLDSQDNYGRQKHETTADPNAIDPEAQTVQRDTIKNFLAQFSGPQRDAIILVYDLDWLLDEVVVQDAETLLDMLGTDNLDTYVDALISGSSS